MIHLLETISITVDHPTPFTAAHYIPL